MYLGAILTPLFFAVGDLDPNISPYTLTPLKVVYKKLRLLVDRGCVDGVPGAVSLPGPAR